MEKSTLPAYQPKLPYPVKVKKDQQDEQYKRFLDMFKTLHINDQFVEALAEMLRYAKFLKELLMDKRKLEELPSVTLSKECSALITSNLPKKENDPGGFIVPCTILELVDEKALADIGERINLMPFKIFQKFGLGELKPTTMTPQLANRSIRMEIFLKDELFEILEDEPFDDEVGEEVMEESHYLVLVAIEVSAPPKPLKEKTYGAKK
ncbi:uncharacterized protein LOC120282795 [Dioscorea cayenensis subsp. rotundata]|uniref:Uncharacterized protein LOC120282795 n=1 Tax=Dioscorea cayennensis subsp. rotundata TaxID=55577 RepID=A0AB40CZX5_DIOCR|nr:uncharacterized protein LOC120282795 [Dioscorea cayenensis subsp. rotundata]